MDMYRSGMHEYEKSSRLGSDPIGQHSKKAEISIHEDKQVWDTTTSKLLHNSAMCIHYTPLHKKMTYLVQVDRIID